MTLGELESGTWEGVKMKDQNNNKNWANFVKTKNAKGLGDTIASITKAVGIQPCGACKKRQEKLNKLFPYANNNSDK